MHCLWEDFFGNFFLANRFTKNIASGGEQSGDCRTWLYNKKWVIIKQTSPHFFWKENQIVHQQISIAQMHCLGKLVWCSTSWFNPMVRSWNRAKCDKHRASNSVIKKTFRTIFLQSQQLLSLSHSIVTCVPIARRFSHQWPSVNIIPYPGRKSELSTDRDVFFSPVFLWQWVRRK